MRIHPSRTFGVLIGTGGLLVSLLMTAVYHYIIAGCPEGWREGGFACIFVPTDTDLGIHLLSYAFMGITLLGTYFWMSLLHKHWTRIHLLVSSLEPLYDTDSELEALTCRLGLADKVRLLNFAAPLSFCAGFTSPRVYLSRGILEKLTPEQLEALLLHEKYHLENRHPLKILMGRLIVSALFFIPILKDVLKRYLIEKEIAADRSAIHYQGHHRGLVGALGKFVQEHAVTPAESLVVGLTENLGSRLDHLTGHAAQQTHRIPMPRLVISLLTTALILVSILAPLSGAHS